MQLWSSHFSALKCNGFPLSSVQLPTWAQSFLRFETSYRSLSPNPICSLLSSHTAYQSLPGQDTFTLCNLDFQPLFKLEFPSQSLSLSLLFLHSLATLLQNQCTAQTSKKSSIFLCQPKASTSFLLPGSPPRVAL